jgi:hypothetical protein
MFIAVVYVAGVSAVAVVVAADAVAAKPAKVIAAEANTALFTKAPNIVTSVSVSEGSASK